MRPLSSLIVLAASVLGIRAPAAGTASPSELHRHARDAFHNAERDLNWLLRTAGDAALEQEGALTEEIDRTKRALACARLDWRAFGDLGGTRSGTGPGSVPARGAEPAPERDVDPVVIRIVRAAT